MTDTAARFDVFCPGLLEVLSVGRGDLRLMVGDSDEDREKARALIEEMLRKGYSIFVETDRGLVKVKSFNPKRMTYVIQGEAETAGTPESPERPLEGRQRRRGGRRPGEVPVAGSRATAVGRTAGG